MKIKERRLPGPVACDFWKLGKRDIGSYGLRRDGDSLVITIRLRE